MAQLGVGPATVRAAVAELVRAGVVETVPGSGTFVTRSAPRRPSGDHSWQAVTLGPAPPNPDALSPLRTPPTSRVIDLASGYPGPDLQPTPLIRRALRSATDRPEAFGRAPTEGVPELRQWFSTAIDRAGDRDILIVPGGQAGLSTSFRALGRPGEVVVTETPTYAGALGAARAAGLVPVAAPIDDGGLMIDAFETVVAQTEARLAYLQPRHHNPTGTGLAGDRRDALLEVAARHRLIVIEDDWLADLDDPATAPPPLAASDPDGHVVHLRSLTKSVAPGMRIAALASVGAIHRRLVAARGAEDFFVAPVLQEAALAVVTDRAWPRHLARLRTTLTERRRHLTRLVDQVDGWEPVGAGGPLHLWLDLPRGVSAEEARDAALRRGVAIVDGTGWFPADPSGAWIRLSCAAEPPAVLDEGAARLSDALGDLLA
jgi:DNA-binding transcriptional MocR family regulator